MSNYVTAKVESGSFFIDQACIFVFLVKHGCSKYSLQEGGVLEMCLLYALNPPETS